MSNETYLQSAAMSRDDLQAVIRRHLTAENAHDLDGTLDTLHSDCVFRDHATGQVWHGRPGAADHYRQWWDAFDLTVVRGEGQRAYWASDDTYVGAGDLARAAYRVLSRYPGDRNRDRPSFCGVCYLPRRPDGGRGILLRSCVAGATIGRRSSAGTVKPAPSQPECGLITKQYEATRHESDVFWRRVVNPSRN